MGSFVIRELRPSDLPRLVDISRPLFALEEAAFGFRYETVRKELSEYRFARFISTLTGKLDLEFLVGELDGIPIGTVMLNRFAQAWYVSMVMVEAAHQRKGYGKQLVEEACARAKELGANRVILHVRSNNEAARRLYSSLGFEDFEHECFYVRESERVRLHPLPTGLSYRRVDRFDRRGLSLSDLCREDSSAEVYGATVRPHLFVRMFWRFSNRGRFERFIITRNSDWVGLYSLFAPSEKEAAMLHLQTLPGSRGLFEIPILERALNRSCEFRAPKLALSMDSRRRELAEACESLRFQRAFESEGMVRRLSSQ